MYVDYDKLEGRVEFSLGYLGGIIVNEEITPYADIVGMLGQIQQELIIYWVTHESLPPKYYNLLDLTNGVRRMVETEQRLKGGIHSPPNDPTQLRLEDYTN